MIDIFRSGDDSKEDPPVPMPNTEVKLLNVDDTWRVTARESRQLPERALNPTYVGFMMLLEKNIPEQLSWQSMRLLTAGSSVRAGLQEPEFAVKIDAICFDRFLMRFLSIFENFDLTKKQQMHYSV